MRFIDSHLHVGQYAELEPILKYAKASETLLLGVSTNRKDSMLTLEFARENAGRVVPFVGVHPSEVAKEPDLEWLEGAAQGAAGLGEIGLDPNYSEIGPGSGQLNAFQAQLALAERLSLPTQVHSRGAEKECLEILSSYSPGSTLLHWFESEAQANGVASRGFLVSFGPALLYSKKLQRMASAYPLDLVLPETDGPVPFSALGGAGGPWLIPSVVFKLAELKRLSFEDIAEAVSRNCTEYLRFSGKG